MAENRDINTNRGNYNELIKGNYYQINQINNYHSTESSEQQPNSSPGAKNLLFPLHGKRHQKVATGDMETQFNIDAQGNLYATTKTWTENKLQGFTGGVFITLVDENQTPIWASQQQRYGVDAVWIGNSNRTETWQAQVPPDVLARARGYGIIQEHTPRARILEWLNSQEGQQIIQSAIASFLQ